MEAFSAALCRGLIEARGAIRHRPRLSAFSAALCRGLIEAAGSACSRTASPPFSAALCRGLIEAAMATLNSKRGCRVFRGFMPRPH